MKVSSLFTVKLHKKYTIELYIFTDILIFNRIDTENSVILCIFCLIGFIWFSFFIPYNNTR